MIVQDGNRFEQDLTENIASTGARFIYRALGSSNYRLCFLGQSILIHYSPGGHLTAMIPRPTMAF